MRNRSPIIFNQKGQSELLGLIIASAIGAIVIAATTTSFVELNKGQQNITRTADALDVKREIESLLSDSVACRQNFLGHTEDGHSHAEDLKAADGSVKYPVNEFIPGFNVRIESWSLRNSIILRSTTPVQQLMILTLLVDKGTEVSGAQKISREIKLWTQRTGAAGTAITDCRAVSGSASDIWLKHDDENHIYNGNFDSEVTIGSQTIPIVSPVPPTNTKLYVLGATQAGSNMHARDGVTARHFEVRGDLIQQTSPAPASPVINSVLGRVGVGTTSPSEALYVNGNLRGVGNLTIGGSLAGADFTANSISVGTDLIVNGSTSLASVDVRGSANYSSTARFDSDLRVDGATVMESTFHHLGGSLGANALAVGGTMVTTGDVLVPRVNTTTGFCIGSNCRNTFATQPCPAGEVAYQNKVDGTITCRPISCNAGQFFRGMSAAGVPICAPLPTATCSAGTYISRYQENNGEGFYTCTPIPPQVDAGPCASGYMYAVIAGMVQCAPLAMIGGDCGPGTAVQRIDSEGRPTCVPTYQNANTCADGEILTGMQPNGTPICSNIAAATSCNSDGEVLSSMSATRSGVCGSVAIKGGSCPNGVRSIASDGDVTCF